MLSYDNDALGSNPSPYYPCMSIMFALEYLHNLSKNEEPDKQKEAFMRKKENELVSPALKQIILRLPKQDFWAIHPFVLPMGNQGF